MSPNILLLDASGIPGRYILSSLLRLNERLSIKLKITVLKRSTSGSKLTDTTKYSTAYIDDFSDTTTLAELLASLQPTIIVSALNAEPSPVLDNYVVDAIIRYHSSLSSQPKTPPVFINGYTLDLLHPTVSNLPASAQRTIQPKIDFAHRLRDLATQCQLRYCTIVNAAFLDYCLVKGYSAVNLPTQTATLIDGGTAPVTGCSLAFVGDVVALVVQYFAFGTEAEVCCVRNRRLRVAETTYTGRTMVECVEKIVGKGFEVVDAKSEDVLEKGQVVRYLNWNGSGAANFERDGFEFGQGVLKRRGLEDICRTAIDQGVVAFEGVGR